LQAGVGWAKSVISTAMRSKLSIAFIVALCLAEVGLAAGGSTPTSIQVYFSPKGGCTEAVVDALTKAKSTVLVQAYSFTSAPIAKALTDAHRRGVKIQVILDRSWNDCCSSGTGEDHERPETSRSVANLSLWLWSRHKPVDTQSHSDDETQVGRRPEPDNVHQANQDGDRG
jgi:phosphatidylserine/phosphatidylglycerophosphate/cardiolipin synthase-like enzyme